MNPVCRLNQSIDSSKVTFQENLRKIREAQRDAEYKKSLEEHRRRNAEMEAKRGFEYIELDEDDDLPF